MTAILMLLPAVAVLALFGGFAMAFGLRISLFDWTGAAEGAYRGLGNYQALLGDPAFLHSIEVTLYLLVLTVPFEIGLGLLLAVLLHRMRRRGPLLVAIFLPQVASLVPIGIIIRWLFSSGNGPVNAGLTAVGLPGLDWLSDPVGLFDKASAAFGLPEMPIAGPTLAVVVVALVTIWVYAGFHMVVFLTGLASIPDELYEAATIDGASAWQKFRRVTIPLLSPTTYLLAVVAVIGALQTFTLVVGVTGTGYGATGTSGAPLGSTKVATLFIFDTFFQFGRAGYAMAAAVLLFVLIFSLTLVQRHVLGRRVFYQGD